MGGMGPIHDNGVLPKERRSHPATYEEMLVVNNHVGLSAARIAAQIKLI